MHTAVTDAFGVVNKLGALLDEEVIALRSRDYSQMGDFNYRKGHWFLELSRVLSSLQANAATDARLQDEIIKLRAKLAENQRVLKLHLDAVGELTGLLARTIRDNEWDGTYSQYSRA